MTIKNQFLNFFESKGHKKYPSMSLLPNDPSIMFTNSGMVQFKDIFIGNKPIPDIPRVTSSQTCLRVGGKHNDLDNVGYTSRHHTLFEMLGNFSFNDYFKEDVIQYSWEFITDKKYLNLPIDKLWVTIHESDDESQKIWEKYISPDRILRFGDKDNFWQMGNTGPCGPCSEIFYDQGEENFNSDEDKMGGEGDRFLEIWNLVFMQYFKDEEGKLTPLDKPCIDTGMGLERVVAIKEGKLNNFDTSLFSPQIKILEDISGKKYEENLPEFRVIVDHMRSIVSLLNEKVVFSNNNEGYVLKKLLRRSSLRGVFLDIENPFLSELVDITSKQLEINLYDVQKIKDIIYNEEIKFRKVLKSGMKMFNKEMSNKSDIFSGEVCFKLSDTYGFPLDLTSDLLLETNKKLDIDEYHRLLNIQKENSKNNN